MISSRREMFPEKNPSHNLATRPFVPTVRTYHGSPIRQAQILIFLKIFRVRNVTGV